MAFDSTYTDFNGRQYKDGAVQGGAGQKSSIGNQLNDFYWYRKSLVDTMPEMFFGQLADTMNMPKHFGKTIKLFHYIPLLDDRNINDQGIDATGQSTAEYTLTLTDAAGFARYFVGTTVANAVAKANAQLAQLGSSATITASAVTSAPQAVSGLTGWTYEIVSAPATGNLYGSSRDVGTITGKLPVLGENGGRVNRVGYKRVELEGSIHEQGFFQEYTEDSIQFDTDAELMSHISRESLRGANKISEDLIQLDLLNGAGIVMYGGDALAEADLASGDVLTYDMLMKLDTVLNNNYCPTSTTLISGSRMVDTKTIASARYAYIGPELKKTLMQMLDYHDKPAFIPVQQYAAAGQLAHGEIGSIGNFRFIENPQMMVWEGAGASYTGTEYRSTNGKLNVYPILVVGSGCFTTIGFHGSGDSTKMKVYNKAPGMQTADRHDPYGKTGFYSVRWWYGSLIKRPEWLACIKVVAPY